MNRSCGCCRSCNGAPLYCSPDSEQEWIPAIRGGPGLGTDHRTKFESSRAEPMAGHGHGPILASELSGAARAAELLIVGHEDRTMDHQLPAAGP